MCLRVSQALLGSGNLLCLCPHMFSIAFPGGRLQWLHAWSQCSPTGVSRRPPLQDALAVYERVTKLPVTLAGWELTPASGSARAISVCYSPAAGTQEMYLHSAPCCTGTLSEAGDGRGWGDA